jgi:hypothetical protein
LVTPASRVPAAGWLARTIRVLVSCACVLWGCALWGCAGGGDLPVAELSVEPQRFSLPYPAYREMQIVLEPNSALDPGADPILFIHLIGEPGEVLRTFDHPLPEPWSAGQPMRYTVRLYQSAMARPLPAGQYQLTVGLYQATGHRWPLDVAGDEVDRYEYQVAQVDVPATSDAEPRFSFTSGWSPAEAGSDRQVLARRWLTGTGQVAIEALPADGLLWMVVHIPPVPARGARVLGADDREPAVHVRASCAASEISVAGIGRHEVELPLALAGAGASTDAGDGPCQLELIPSFYDQLEGSFDRRSAALEALAWVGR